MEKIEYKDLVTANETIRKRVTTALVYIDKVIDERNEKHLSIIKEELLGEGSSTISTHQYGGEAKPPRRYNCFDCELPSWKQLIRLLAEKMSRLNFKKNQ